MRFAKEVRALKRIKREMKRKENAPAAGMAMAGFSLSPLSLWNEGYVNLPLSYLGATAVSLYSQELFTISLVFFYWLTNFAGLILFELGLETVLHKPRHLSKKLLMLDVLASLLITAVLIYLVEIGLIRPLSF